MIAAAMSSRAVMAELTGRDAGVSRWKCGSMHIFDVEKGFYGGHGIAGDQISMAQALHSRTNTAAMAQFLAYMGDDEVNQGEVAESLNMADVHSLPVIYVIENNHYAMGASVGHLGGAFDDGGAAASARRGLPGELVDGMDILAVRQADARALARAAAGERSTILEMETTDTAGTRCQTRPNIARARRSILSLPHAIRSSLCEP